MHFRLQPPSSPIVDAPHSIEGSVKRITATGSGDNAIGAHDHSQLRFVFNSIQTQPIIWPALQPEPERRDGLWESTCFECFIGLAGEETYIELNISPSGHWQAYLFSSYRQSIGICNEINLNTRIDSEPNGHKSISCMVDILHPSFVTSSWKISMSAVLAFANGDLGYYASKHPNTKPDFHLAGLRNIELSAG